MRGNPHFAARRPLAGCACVRRYKEPAMSDRQPDQTPDSQSLAETTAAIGSGPTNYGYAEHGLYREAFERDSCGFGLIAHMDDQPSHKLVQTAITALHRMTHRGAVAADGK